MSGNGLYQLFCFCRGFAGTRIGIDCRILQDVGAVVRGLDGRLAR